MEGGLKVEIFLFVAVIAVLVLIVGSAMITKGKTQDTLNSAYDTIFELTQNQTDVVFSTVTSNTKSVTIKEISRKSTSDDFLKGKKSIVCIQHSDGRITGQKKFSYTDFKTQKDTYYLSHDEDFDKKMKNFCQTYF
jgi:hypothetical protein